MDLARAQTQEWLEADGLGGFASGTASGIRTRRYHALLLTATTPPTGRIVLVNGCEAWIETSAGVIPLSSQRYAPGVIHPDGATRIVAFAPEPWPRWVYRLADGTEIVHELFVPHERAAVVLHWHVAARAAGSGPMTLKVRLLISGRDYHNLHHENGSFAFEAQRAGELILVRPYSGLPAIAMRSNGAYEDGPDWYRNFLYSEESARGLDATEDLASPGLFTFDLGRGEATMVLAAEAADWLDALGADLGSAVAALRAAESERRAGFPGPLHRAADAYIVRRGAGRTIVAGYPWFTDWGRDTFIALRGLCLAGGRLADARAILVEWASAVSEGMLPNLYPEGSGPAEYNAVDASLWYVIAVHDYLACAAREAIGSGAKPQARSAAAAGSATDRSGDPSVARTYAADRELLGRAVCAILDGYARGTRFGIRADGDGLLAAGATGVPLTWMDAKVGDWVVTPRIGKPVEVQALWLNALRIGGAFEPRWRGWIDRGTAAFRRRFWSARNGFLNDVVDVDHRPGTADATLRPNQIFAVGGLPYALLEGEQARRVVDAVEGCLLTPFGLRTLAPSEPGYAPRYGGGPRERDGAYHQGTVWPWLMGPFVEAWVRVRGGGPTVRREARIRFLEPLLRLREEVGLGHIAECADAEPPYTPRGCPFQAWSVGEALRLDGDVLAEA